MFVARDRCVNTWGFAPLALSLLFIQLSPLNSSTHRPSCHSRTPLPAHSSPQDLTLVTATHQCQTCESLAQLELNTPFPPVEQRIQMESSASTTPTPTFTVLFKIIPGPGIRPLQSDGQYYPRHAVHEIRLQWLKTMFAPHDLIKILPCLNPWNGNAFPELFIATFRDFDAYHGALGSWNSTELEPNAFIRMVVFLNIIEEDTKNAQLLGPIQGSKTVKPSRNLPAPPLYHPENLFEDWWAALDPDNWNQRRRRIEHKALLSHCGAWLYYSYSGERSFRSDPISFSFETPAILEYEFLSRNLRNSRKKEAEEPVTTIDWDATHQCRKLSLQLSSSFTMYMEQLKIGSPSASSDEEDAFELENEARPDTPNTSPPTSPRTGSNLLSAHGINLMSLEDFEEHLGRETSLAIRPSHLQPGIKSTQAVVAPATGLMKELETLMSRLPTYSEEELGIPDMRKEVAAAWVLEPEDIGDLSNKHSRSSNPTSIYDFMNGEYALRQRGSPVEPFGLRPSDHGPVAAYTAENTTYLFTDQMAAWYAAADDVKPAGHSSQDFNDNLAALMKGCAASTASGDTASPQSSSIELVVQSSNESHIDPEQEWYASLLAEPKVEKVYSSTIEHGTSKESYPGDILQARLSAQACDDELLAANDITEHVAGPKNSQLVEVAHITSKDGEDAEVAVIPCSDDQQLPNDGLMVSSSFELLLDEHVPPESSALEMIGTPTVGTTCDTSYFWTKLFMLPVFDYFSLGLLPTLPTLIHHPIFSLLVFLMLYVVSLQFQELKEKNERLRNYNEVLRGM
ncbi:hypothetical protein HBI07_135990 [Parastagonospora nodorum]|nr:hypothetical protein HBI07_135990 [Parastagonospora nodorum]